MPDNKQSTLLNNKKPRSKIYSELTLRKIIRNAVPIFSATAAPTITHGICSSGYSAENDPIYTAMPLWAITLIVATIGLTIHYVSDRLIEKKWPHDPSKRYKLDKVLMTGINFTSESNYSIGSTEEIPLINKGPKKNCCNTRNITRTSIRNLIPLMIAVASSLTVDAITEHTPGAKYQFYTNVPPWVTTLAIILLTLTTYSATDFLVEQCWPKDPSSKYRRSMLDTSLRIIHAPKTKKAEDLNSDHAPFLPANGLSMN